MKIRYILIILFCISFHLSHAQYVNEDSVKTNKMQNDTLAKQHSPRLATILSAVLPGAGQTYNRKFWKIPVIYAGFAVVGYGVYSYGTNYVMYDKAYDKALADENPYAIYTVKGQYGYSLSDLKSRRDFYRQYRDLFIIIGGLWYVLNIIDANVDAHFFDFDVADDLSLRLQHPTELESPMGIAIALHF